MKYFSFFYFILALCITHCSNASVGNLSQSINSHSNLSLLINNYAPLSSDQYINLFAVNMNGRVGPNANILIDTDSDGVPDENDNNTVLNILPTLPDTNFDNYSDLLMFVLGIASVDQPSLRYCPSPPNRTIPDILNDCERNLLGLGLNVDTDGDGMPDGLELLFGTDPSVNDSHLDPDGDGYTNIQEMAMGTPVTVYNTPDINSYAISYSVEGITGTSPTQYTVLINNIPLSPTGAQNKIALYFVERASSGALVLRTYKVFATYNISPIDQQMTMNFSSLQTLFP